MLLRIMVNILRMHADPLRPRRFRRVSRAAGGGFIQLHRVDGHFVAAALRQHQRDQPAAAADVQHPARLPQRRPGAEQHPVGAHFHGATIVCDKELFKGKTPRRG